MASNGNISLLLVMIVVFAGVLSSARPTDAGFSDFLQSVRKYLYGDTCFLKQYRLCRSINTTDRYICIYSALQLCDIWLEGWEQTEDYDKFDPDKV